VVERLKVIFERLAADRNAFFDDQRGLQPG
jgi:hypothetical protein